MTTTENGTARYTDPSVPIDERVADLLARMTDDEKRAQLGSLWAFEIAQDGRLDSERAPDVLEHGLGQVTRIAGASFLDARSCAELVAEVQRYLVEQTRLGIPAIIHEEVCSGLMAREATIFPQAIGVASTWMPELNQRLAAAVAVEMRAMGATQGLSPVLDVARDARWGRVEETYGEDPMLVASMGVAFVSGLQGEDLSNGVIATAKHFVGYGLSEGGLNWAPAHMGERELRDVFLRPFEAAVRLAGLGSVMNGYNEIDGIPCAANRVLFEEILREQWGFSGIVVSDYFSIRHLEAVHHVARDRAGAAALALASGIDVELPTVDCYGEPLAEALAQGQVDTSALDEAVSRVLGTKFALGLFERPWADPDTVGSVVRTPEQRELAREIAVRSQVLLRNDDILPLEDVTSIAVIGPNADDVRNLLGDYSYPAHAESLKELMESGTGAAGLGGVEESAHGSGRPEDSSTEPNAIDRGRADDVAEVAAPTDAPSILDVIRRRLGERTRITFAPGCAVNDQDRSGFPAAVDAAAAADVAVLIMGDRSGLTLESTSGESRDVASLDLPGVQEELVLAVAATGTPVVLVLVSGRPNGSEAVHEAASAVLMSWLPGETGAEAIVDVVTGAVNPGGKLPITYPRSSGQIPIRYGHKVSGGKSNWKGDYVNSPVSPRYPFGFGLSYTTFDVEVVDPASDSAGIDGAVSLVAAVTNTGTRAGDEVVQVYSRVPVASVTRPVLELVGFARLDLQPGQRRRVAVEIPVSQLGFHDRDMQYRVESGDVEFFVGTSAADLVPAGTTDVRGGRPEHRAFAATVAVENA